MKLSELYPQLDLNVRTKTITENTYTLSKLDHNSFLIFSTTSSSLNLTIPTDLTINFTCVFKILNPLTLTITTPLFLRPNVNVIQSLEETFFVQLVLDTIYIQRSIDSSSITNILDNYISGNLSSTDQLPEGTINLYYTEARVNSLLNSLISNITNNTGQITLDIEVIEPYVTEALSLLESLTTFNVGQINFVQLVSSDFPNLLINTSSDLDSLVLDIKPLNTSTVLFSKAILDENTDLNIEYYIDLSDKILDNTLVEDTFYRLEIDSDNHLIFKVVPAVIQPPIVTISINDLSAYIGDTISLTGSYTSDHVSNQILITFNGQDYAPTSTTSTTWTVASINTTSLTANTYNLTSTITSEGSIDNDGGILTLSNHSNSITINTVSSIFTSTPNKLINGTYSTTASSVTSIKLSTNGGAYLDVDTINTGLTTWEDSINTSSLSAGNYNLIAQIIAGGVTVNSTTATLTVSNPTLSTDTYVSGPGSFRGAYSSNTDYFEVIVTINSTDYTAVIDEPVVGSFQANYSTLSSGTHSYTVKIQTLGGAYFVTNSGSFTVS